MNMKLLAVAAASLAAGAAIGWFAKPGGEHAPDASAESAKAKKTAERPATNSEKALLARIKELELALARKNRVATAVPVNAQEARAEGRRRRGEGSFGERMREEIERMKKEEPERYAAMTNRIARDERRRAERTVGKLDFLSSIDTSRMTPEGKAVHAKLQELIARREEFDQRRHSLPDMEESARRRYFEEMRQTDREIRRLSLQERDNLLRQTTDALGFSGGAADEIIETVKEIYEATEGGFDRMPPPRHGGMMRRGGRAETR